MLLSVLSGLCMLLIVGGTLFAVITLARRHGWERGVIVAGAVTFVVSQVVHLPLNYWLAQIGILPSVAPISNEAAVVLGLSAGVCEELARYGVLLWWMRRVRDWKTATAFGMGHGGVEAFMIGILGGFTVINLVALQTMDLSQLGLEGDALAAVQAQVVAFQEQPLWMPFMGVFERVMAIGNHVWMSTLVVLSVVRRNPLYLLAAIAWHTVLNAGALIVLREAGVLACEGTVLLMTAAAMAMWWRMQTALGAQTAAQ